MEAMKLKKWSKPIGMAIVIMMLFASLVSAEGESDQVGVFPELNFTDVTENWSYKHITKLALLGVINGRGNGTFAPNDSVSQQDVVIMAVQFMGAAPDDDDSHEVVLPFDVDDYAKPYVSVAVEQNLLNIDEEESALDEGEHWGKKHASREWVAKMTIRSLGLEDLAQGMEGLETTFYDRDLISEGFESYIRAAVELEIVNGLPGNVFDPKAPVTRAQMAVFLSLGEAHLDKVSPRVVAGTITAWNDDEVELRTNDGESTTFTMHDQVRYFSKEVNDRMVSPSTFTLGDHVYLIHFNEQALYVEWVEEGEEIEPDLQVTPYKLLLADSEHMELTLERDGAVRIYPVSPEVEITDEFDQPLTLEDLVPNSLIDVLQDRNDPEGTALEIQAVFIPIDKTAVGKFESFDASTNTIWVQEEDSGEQFQYPILEEAEFIYRNMPLEGPEELKEGDEILYRVENSEIIRIELLETIEPRWEEIQGTVSAFNLEDGLISIRKLDGTPVAYNLLDEVEVLLDGKANATLSDLRTSDQVRIQINTLESNRVEQIRILNRSISAIGLVEVIHYSERTGSFTVYDPETEDVRVFKMNDETTVNDADYWTSDMLNMMFPEGRKVNVIANENELIHIENARHYEGTVLSINTSNRTMELESDIYGKMSFRWMSSAVKPADVQVGSRVRVALDGSQQYVSQFAILEQRVMVISRIDTGDHELIAHDPSGKEYVIDLENVNTGNRNLKAQEPILVELAGDEVQSVTIPQVEQGEVSQIDGTTVHYVTRDGEAKSQTIDHITGVSIEGQGLISIDRLEVGDKAQLLIDPNEGNWHLHVYASESRNFWQYHAATQEIQLRRGSFDQDYKFTLHADAIVYTDENDALDISDLLDGDRIKVYYLHDQIIEIERQ